MSKDPSVVTTLLSPDRLYTACDIGHIPFVTSDEVDESEKIVGQNRALEAIHLGTRIEGQGYNVFALGASGTGKFSIIERILKEEAKSRPAPSDWCYVFNFAEPHKPRALELPSGRAISLKQDMAQLVDDLKNAIPAAFEAEEYHAKIDKIQQELEARRNGVLQDLAEQAKKDNIQLIHTQTGFAFAPLDESGEVVIPETYNKLSEDEQAEVEGKISALQKKLQLIIRQFPAWQKEAHKSIKETDREIARTEIGHLINQMREEYKDLQEVLIHLVAVEEDIIENIKTFQPQSEPTGIFGFSQGGQSDPLVKYKVNILVNHAKNKTAPVVYQDLPNHSNLIGRVEYRSQMGTLHTDFTLIKAGDLHCANGGYLILDVRELLMQPYAWQSLKRALRAQEIRIEPIERTLGLISTVSLDPEPVPLDVKVVLMGDHQLYYLLGEYDPDFQELFKVAADFDDAMPRNPENCDHIARIIARMAKENSLRPVENKAVARLIEHGSRLIGDSTKISTQLRTFKDILREANYWSSELNKSTISREGIQQAIDKRIHRLDRLRSRIYEAIESEVIRIEIVGDRVAQANGLSVLSLGEFTFGQPSRITGTSRFGTRGIIDIEREANLGGDLHSKGVLILASFLSSRYAPKSSLSLSASLVFEQSYGKVDGDSASLAELCVLLSSLSDVPIQQRYAMTGSVDQHGRVQAIGGANQKIEGFFDVCTVIGMNGTQGVLIPASNVKNLMLRSDVVEAVREKRFQIHAIETVDQAIEILTGKPAGSRDSKGKFPFGSINSMVEARLVQMAGLRERGSGYQDSTGTKRRHGNR